MLAALLVVCTAAVSIFAVRRRLPYEVWHALHLLVYVVIVLAIIHQLYEGSAFKTNALTQLYWWALWAFAIGALLTGRLIVPLVRNARHQFTVAAVVPESDDVVSVYTTGRNLDRLPARAGQFFLWRFPGHNGWWQVNPFSLSAAPDGRSLRLTAKGIGVTSSGLRNLPVGTRVFAEGPYGAFTAAQRTRTDTLLIAGGIGVTPIRALLEDEALTGDIVVLYRVHDEADAVLLGELRDLAADPRGASAPAHRAYRGGRAAEPSRSARRTCCRLVPDVTERDAYVCGPCGDDRRGAAHAARAGRPTPSAARRKVPSGELTSVRPYRFAPIAVRFLRDHLVPVAECAGRRVCRSGRAVRRRLWFRPPVAVRGPVGPGARGAGRADGAPADDSRRATDRPRCRTGPSAVPPAARRRRRAAGSRTSGGSGATAALVRPSAGSSATYRCSRPPPPPEPIMLPPGDEVPYLSRLPVTQPVAFLTIDDGYLKPGEAPKLLAAAHVPVTLFLTTDAIQRRRAVLRPPPRRTAR